MDARFSDHVYDSGENSPSGVIDAPMVQICSSRVVRQSFFSGGRAFSEIYRKQLNTGIS